jgi:hypothetical protein
MKKVCCAIVAAVFLVGADAPQKKSPAFKFTVRGDQVVVQTADFEAVAREIKWDSEREILTLAGSPDNLTELKRKSPSRAAEIIRAEKIVLHLEDGSIDLQGASAIRTDVAK